MQRYNESICWIYTFPFQEYYKCNFVSHIILKICRKLYKNQFFSGYTEVKEKRSTKKHTRKILKDEQIYEIILPDFSNLFL